MRPWETSKGFEMVSSRRGKEAKKASHLHRVLLPTERRRQPLNPPGLVRLQRRRDRRKDLSLLIERVERV